MNMASSTTIGGASNGTSLQLTETETRLIEGVKVEITKKLRGDEDPNTRAVVFYATASRLAAESKRIDALTRIKFLAKIVNHSHATDIYLGKLFKIGEQKILIPSPNWTVMSFHDADGKILSNLVEWWRVQKLKISDFQNAIRRQMGNFW